MKAPDLQGVIGRRLLINFRTDPEVVAALLPAPFRPQIVGGFAVAGLCLLRLEELRPVGFPRFLGQQSENAAHRIAVEWDTDDGVANGVYITRRDSDSLLNVIAGGRVFPGKHQRSRFTVAETESDFAVGFHSLDGSASAKVEARFAPDLSESLLFADIGEASRFFESGSIGYSCGPSSDHVEGMELATTAWKVEPLRVDRIASSFFDDGEQFPSGSVSLDCGLVMRRVPVTWRSAGSMAKTGLAGTS
jgi:hypothetical protein